MTDKCQVWISVFKLDTTGNESLLYSFANYASGANPYAAVLDKGTFYGTTFAGGGIGCGGNGCGSVFKLTKTGVEKVLYGFTGNYVSGDDGAYPYPGLVRDAVGNLYGTTAHGGNGGGVVFKISSTGTETLLHTFTGTPDGANPYGSLIRDKGGNLFGTTTGGGTGPCVAGCGTVFKITSTGTETILYSFTGSPSDGSIPYSGLFMDSAGNLYGTTSAGGVLDRGTVFKISKTGIETLIYSFSGMPDGADPVGGLVRDAKGNLYGTTYLGGVSNLGVVFKVTKTGKESVLYSFAGGTDGANPYAGLVLDSAGNLYGTTVAGGTSGTGCYFNTCGTVFKLSPK